MLDIKELKETIAKAEMLGATDDSFVRFETRNGREYWVKDMMVIGSDLLFEIQYNEPGVV